MLLFFDLSSFHGVRKSDPDLFGNINPETVDGIFI